MFASIIDQLIRSGLTEKQIGALVGASQASINRIRNSKQSPAYELGRKIEALHADRCGASPLSPLASPAAAGAPDEATA